MENRYKVFLEDFFLRLLDYKHTSSRLNKILILDYQKFTEDGASYYSGSSLILNDWTGETDNGWAIPIHTGISKETLKENYKNEILNVLSREFCLIYSQSYEALEKYFKDCVFFKASHDVEFQELVKKKNNIDGELRRECIKGGDNLYKLIKKLGKKTLLNFSKENNCNIKFGELLKVLSEVRHSIVHSNSVIDKSKINITDYHFEIFCYLFDYVRINDEKIKIQLNFEKFKLLIDTLNGFAFQIYKALSLEENLNWSYKN